MARVTLRGVEASGAEPVIRAMWSACLYLFLGFIVHPETIAISAAEPNGEVRGRYQFRTAWKRPVRGEGLTATRTLPTVMRYGLVRKLAPLVGGSSGGSRFCGSDPRISESSTVAFAPPSTPAAVHSHGAGYPLTSISRSSSLRAYVTLDKSLHFRSTTGDSAELAGLVLKVQELCRIGLC